MSDVPSDLYRKILIHLPAESLLRFRAVCRAWCCIIDDPSFIKLHTLSQHSSRSSLLIGDSKCSRLYSLYPHSLMTYAHDAQQTVYLTTVKNLVGRGVPRLRDLQRMMSCNGMILLYPSKFKKDWVIWNPVTRDFLSLFGFGDNDHLEGGTGLGYDYAADDYKVVRINSMSWEGGYVLRTRVYSVKSRRWKWIKYCSSDTELRLGFGVHLNGAIYWISKTVIVMLDLATEEYRLLQLPPQTTEQRCLINDLNAMDGCLIITCYYMIKHYDGSQADQCLDVWIMKDEITLETPWIKLLSLVNDRSVGFGDNGKDFTLLKLISYSQSRGEIIMNRGSHFYCFDILKNFKKKFTIDGLPEYFSCQNFQGSLVRLVGDDDGSAAGAKRKRKRTCRLKLSVTVDDL